MSTAKFEKEILAGEARLFDPERDMKKGKQILIDSGSAVFFADTLRTLDNKEVIHEERLITQGDTITIIDISKQDIVLRVQTGGADLEAGADIFEYKVKKEIFSDVLSGVNIKVIKARKASKIQKVENETKKIVEKITRPSLSEIQEGSVLKVVEEGFLLPQRKKSTRFEKSNFNEYGEPFQLMKGDIIRVVKKEKATRNAQNPYILELELEVFSGKGNDIVERIEILTSVGEFQEYMSGVLKPLKDTQKVRDKVALLLDKSKIVSSTLFGTDDDGIVKEF